MKELTVVIPFWLDEWQSDRVERIKYITLDRDRKLIEGVEFLLVDATKRKMAWSEELESICRDNDLSYIRQETDEDEVSISEVRNFAAKNVRSRFVMFFDVDLIPYTGFFQDVLDEIYIQKLDVYRDLFLMFGVVYLTEMGTKAFFNSNERMRKHEFLHYALEGDREYIEKTSTGTSVCLYDRLYFLSKGGNDEGFCGWGGEDQEFNNRLISCLDVFPEPKENHKNIKSFSSVDRYAGWKSRYRLFGDLTFSKGIFLFHSWHSVDVSGEYQRNRLKNLELVENRILSPKSFAPIYKGRAKTLYVGEKRVFSPYVVSFFGGVDLVSCEDIKRHDVSSLKQYEEVIYGVGSDSLIEGRVCLRESEIPGGYEIVSKDDLECKSSRYLLALSGEQWVLISDDVYERNARERCENKTIEISFHISLVELNEGVFDPVCLHDLKKLVVEELCGYEIVSVSLNFDGVCKYYLYGGGRGGEIIHVYTNKFRRDLGVFDVPSNKCYRLIYRGRLFGGKGVDGLEKIESPYSMSKFVKLGPNEEAWFIPERINVDSVRSRCLIDEHGVIRLESTIEETLLFWWGSEGKPKYESSRISKIPISEKSMLYDRYRFSGFPVGLKCGGAVIKEQFVYPKKFVQKISKRGGVGCLISGFHTVENSGESVWSSESVSILAFYSEGECMEIGRKKRFVILIELSANENIPRFFQGGKEVPIKTIACPKGRLKLEMRCKEGLLMTAFCKSYRMPKVESDKRKLYWRMLDIL